MAVPFSIQLTRFLLSCPTSAPSNGGWWNDAGVLRYATPPLGGEPPAAITEYWIAGSGLFQDSGLTTPVTAAGQTVSRWVGERLLPC